MQEARSTNEFAAFERNRDTRRCLELLGLEQARFTTGLEVFTELPCDRLEALIQERFIDGTRGRFGAPAPDDLVRFMRRWPAVRAHGIAHDLGEAQGRVVVEGVECDLGEVEESFREDLREEFEWFCGDANCFVTERDFLFACWG